MRLVFIALLLLLCTCAPAPSCYAGVPAPLPEPTVAITGFGVGLVSDGVCTPGGNPANCAALDNTTTLVSGPGAAIAIYIEWTNEGATTIVDVVVTDENDEKIFNNVTDPLLPDASAFGVGFINAPTTPGEYVFPITLTAINADTRQTTELTRFILTVDATLPVELTSFSANVDKQAVDLHWATSQEIDHAGFTVERKDNAGNFVALPGVPQRTVLPEVVQYSFRDEAVPAGDIFYRLKQQDVSGAINYSNIIQVRIDHENLLPYPNPATHRINLPASAGATLFDATGKLVIQQANLNSWMDLSLLPAGTYWLKLDGKVFPIIKQ